MKTNFAIISLVIYLNYHQTEGKSLSLEAETIAKSLQLPLIMNINQLKRLDGYKRATRQANFRGLKNMQQFQEMLDKAKVKCANELGLNPHISAKSLLYEEHPTLEEKCLSACILEKTNLMDSNYRLNAKTITQIASLVSNDNPMVVSVALNTANNCNNLINAKEACEAAHQINKCIANQLKANQVKLFY